MGSGITLKFLGVNDSEPVRVHPLHDSVHFQLCNVQQEGGSKVEQIYVPEDSLSDLQVGEVHEYKFGSEFVRVLDNPESDFPWDHRDHISVYTPV